MITTSRSAVSTYLQCPRRRYLAYEAPNGTATPGWERRRLALPLVTGIYVHQGLEMALKGMNPRDAANDARVAYYDEVAERGLQVEEGSDEAKVVDEQAAHVEALVLAWCRVRLPRWLDEYEVVEVEAEDRVPLSDDVVLAVRADVIVRRKYDGRMFVVNFKTVGQADDRWLRSWEVDMQLMTELLAAERRHGHEFGGVIIEGLIKGRRMPEKNSTGDTVGYRDSTPLLYGYKTDANPPLTQLEYGWEYTRRKGWYKFPVWKESFASQGTASSLDYWINWLPEEVVEGCFITVPPIMRDGARIEHKVTQVIEIERRIRVANHAMEDAMDNNEPVLIQDVLDAHFPQNEHACTYPSKCSHYDICWSPGVGDDVAGSGLYSPRRDHHAVEGTGE